ncbi:MAG: hypothetical protein BRC58_06265 [Cyanobacteria bacterium QS_8_64_29]|nr:MAG: hypothetical protein BRC58_06265 [Cyanobacteria bacterium QS_8_64_29]
MLTPTIRRLGLSGGLLLPLLVLAGGPAARAQSQSVPPLPEGSPQQRPASSSSERTRSSERMAGSFLSMSGAQQLMEQASAAIENEQYQQATQNLQQARRAFNQISNFYQQLSSSFSGVNNQLSKAQRENALKAAQKRDEAAYQLALVHRKTDDPDLAVPLLVQVVSSQDPSTELGRKAYQQLYEIGFVETQYQGGGSTSSGEPSQS